MTDEDRARAADRLLNDPMLIDAMERVRANALSRLLLADDDNTMRRARDEILALDGIKDSLRNAILKVQVANRPRVERA